MCMRNKAENVSECGKASGESIFFARVKSYEQVILGSLVEMESKKNKLQRQQFVCL